MSMIPVTTPTFIIFLEDAENHLANSVEVRVDIRQQDVLLSKSTQDLVIDPVANTIAVTLTQKESAKFLYKKGDLKFQVHGLLNDGSAWKTFVVADSVEETLSKEIISHDSEH